MSRMLTVILVAFGAAAFIASDAFARGGGHGGGGRGGGGGFRGGGGGYHGGGVHVGGFRAGGVQVGAFRAGGVPMGAFRGGAAVHVGGFPGRPVPFGGIRPAPIRRFAVPPPLVVGYPYWLWRSLPGLPARRTVRGAAPAGADHLWRPLAAGDPLLPMISGRLGPEPVELKEEPRPPSGGQGSTPGNEGEGLGGFARRLVI